MSQLVLSQSIVDDEVNSDNLCSLPLSPSNNNTGFPLFSQQLELEDEEHQIHLYLKAVLDHKYDGEQIRNLSLSLRRKALKNGEEIAIDTPLETILELPVCLRKMRTNVTQNNLLPIFNLKNQEKVSNLVFHFLIVFTY